MSHFTVMVIGENPEKQLAPFQENNMGDCPKEFLEWISVEDDYETIDEAVEDGYKLKNGVPGYLENPNRKWDWYQLGGRWSGMLKLKNGAEGNNGTPGLMTSPACIGYCDQAIKMDIDIVGMRKEAIKKASMEYDIAHEVIAGEEFEKWESIRTRFDKINEAREYYHSQPVLKRWVASKKIQDNLGFFSGPSDFMQSKKEYLQQASNSALSTFAIIKDGKWYEKGEMGWFACVSDEKDREHWNKEFNQIFDEIPDDTLISIYDCHI